MSNSFQHKKSLGQHFLTSDVVPKWMGDAAMVAPSNYVLEIGPGTGILTKELLRRGAIVHALEADPRAIAELQTLFISEIQSQQLIVEHVDVRTYDWSLVPFPPNTTYKVVANIPYYLSGFLFRCVLTTSHQPSDVVFLVQKEVAKRASGSLAHGQKESLLSLSVQAYGEARYVTTIGRGHFVPPPQVDSGIIHIGSISRDRFASVDEEAFFTILHLGFAQKRKQLLGNLTKHYDRSTLTDIFSTLKLPLTIRAEDVPIATWCALTTQLGAKHP